MTEPKQPADIPADVPYAPPAPVGKSYMIPHGRAFRPADATDAPQLPNAMLEPDPDVIYPAYESSIPRAPLPAVMVEPASGKQQAALGLGITGLVLGGVAAPFVFVFVYFFVALFTGFNELTWIAILGVVLPLALSVVALVLNNPRRSAVTPVGVIGVILAAGELLTILIGITGHSSDY